MGWYQNFDCRLDGWTNRFEVLDLSKDWLLGADAQTDDLQELARLIRENIEDVGYVVCHYAPNRMLTQGVIDFTHAIVKECDQLLASNSFFAETVRSQVQEMHKIYHALFWEVVVVWGREEEWLS